MTGFEALSDSQKIRVRSDFVSSDEAFPTYLVPQASVVFSTLTLSGEELLCKEFKPDILIIDEAGQSTELDTLIPLVSHELTLKAVFFVGDDLQLEPVVTSGGKNEFSHQLEQSPFTRLFAHEYYRRRLLDQCYRFRAEHGQVISRIFYNDSLTFVAQRQAIEGRFHSWASVKWQRQSFAHSRVAVDAGRARSTNFQGSTSLYNQTEAQAVAAIARSLVQDAGIKEDDILILSPYTGQVITIAKLLRNYPEIRIMTFTQSQGSERLLVITSWVKSPGHPRSAAADLLWIANDRRMNVGLTRQKAVGIHAGQWIEDLDMSEQLYNNVVTENFAKLLGDFRVNEQYVSSASRQRR